MQMMLLAGALRAMQAYKLQTDFSNRCAGYSPQMTTLFLPSIRCECCKRDTGHWDSYHPSVKCAPRLIAMLKRFKKAMTVEQFQNVRSRLPARNKALGEWLPGSQVGLQRIRIYEPPPDCVLDMNCSIISDRALKILRSEGVKVYAGEVELLYRRSLLGGWRAIDFPDLRLMTDKSFEASGHTKCPRCEDVRPSRILPAAKLLHGHADHELIRSRWPKGLGLARLCETMWRVPSPEFIRTWKKHKLTGINFVPIGKWV